MVQSVLNGKNAKIVAKLSRGIWRKELRLNRNSARPVWQGMASGTIDPSQPDRSERKGQYSGAQLTRAPQQLPE